MKRTLRALFVEDSEDDARLLLRALQAGGFAVEWARADTDASVRAALTRGPWDIVFSDFSMPGYGALAAFTTVRALAEDVPFVIVSGTVGEDTAVQAMREGVNDYLLKDRLSRLVPIVERELSDAAHRREERALAARLRDAERKIEQIAASIRDVFWSARVDSAGRPALTYVSPASVAVLGHEPRALLDRPELWTDAIEVKDRDSVAAALNRAIAEGSETRCNYRVHVGAQVRWVESAVVPVRGADGAIELHGVVRDITDQQRMKEQLMLADRMVSIGTIAAGVAHEINNPLVVVVTGLEYACDLLDQEAALEGTKLGDVRAALADVSEAAWRVRNIVRDLKVFSRADEERQGPVDVHAVLDSSARMAQNEIRHRARLVRNFGEVPWVEANESRLGQVFLNLFINAAQAIEGGTIEANEIRVSTALDPSGRVAIEVTDTGCGMSPTVAARIFDPFFTTKAIGVGTGLGLAICHRIVADCGGEITLHSEVGHGTTFRVLLLPARKIARRDPAPVLPARRTGRARILVIDDEPAIGSVIQRALETEGNVETSTSAAAVLRQIADGARYDVIFCDLMMPDTTGMDFYAGLQRTVPELADRVVFLTGGAFTPRARAFLDTVTNVRLDKPFDLQSLRRVLRERAG